LADGLGIPFDFESIKSEIHAESEDGNTVTVYLQTAIKFIMDLEEKQKEALPETLSQEEETLYIEYLRSRGYKGDDLRYPYRPRIELSSSETAVAPITLSSQQYLRRCRGEQLGRFGVV
jgi:hypothetical protein